jgi:hypothetical protein
MYPTGAPGKLHNFFLPLLVQLPLTTKLMLQGGLMLCSLSYSILCLQSSIRLITNHISCTFRPIISNLIIELNRLNIKSIITINIISNFI